MPINHLNLCFPITTTTTTTTKSPNLTKTFNSLFETQTNTNHKSPNLTNTFNSIYSQSTTTTPISDPESDSESDTSQSPPDFATAAASRRFFFSSPGRSNSIIDSTSSLSSSSSSSLSSGTIAVPTYSPDPYADFRRSMQEMVEARDLHDVPQNWDYLHDLLMCYLELNPKSTHKYIVGAFADLLVSLTAESGRRRSSLRRRVVD